VEEHSERGMWGGMRACDCPPQMYTGVGAVTARMRREHAKRSLRDTAVPNLFPLTSYWRKTAVATDCPRCTLEAAQDAYREKQATMPRPQTTAVYCRGSAGDQHLEQLSYCTADQSGDLSNVQSFGALLGRAARLGRPCSAANCHRAAGLLGACREPARP